MTPNIEPSNEAPIWLEVIGGPEDGELFCGYKDEINIGRWNDTYPNDLALNNLFCSRRHAMIRQNQGKWVLVDRQSENGTVLRGRVIDPAHAELLLDMDYLAIGPTIIQFSTRPRRVPSVKPGIPPLSAAVRQIIDQARVRNLTNGLAYINVEAVFEELASSPSVAITDFFKQSSLDSALVVEKVLNTDCWKGELAWLTEKLNVRKSEGLNNGEASMTPRLQTVLKMAETIVAECQAPNTEAIHFLAAVLEEGGGILNLILAQMGHSIENLGRIALTVAREHYSPKPAASPESSESNSKSSVAVPLSVPPTMVEQTIELASDSPPETRTIPEQGPSKARPPKSNNRDTKVSPARPAAAQAPPPPAAKSEKTGVAQPPPPQQPVRKPLDHSAFLLACEILEHLNRIQTEMQFAEPSDRFASLRRRLKDSLEDAGPRQREAVCEQLLAMLPRLGDSFSPPPDLAAILKPPQSAPEPSSKAGELEGPEETAIAGEAENAIRYLLDTKEFGKGLGVSKQEPPNNFLRLINYLYQYAHRNEKLIAVIHATLSRDDASRNFLRSEFLDLASLIAKLIREDDPAIVDEISQYLDTLRNWQMAMIVSYQQAFNEWIDNHWKRINPAVIEDQCDETGWSLKKLVKSEADYWKSYKRIARDLNPDAARDEFLQILDKLATHNFEMESRKARKMQRNGEGD